MAKKGKKGKKKVKKSLSPEEQKKELVSALVAKCEMTEEEVLKAYDEFHEKNKKGVIGKEEFVRSRKVVFSVNIFVFCINWDVFRTA